MDKIAGRPLPFHGFGTIPEARGGHRCEGSLPEAAYGKAITYCYEDAESKDGENHFMKRRAMTRGHVLELIGIVPTMLYGSALMLYSPAIFLPGL